MAENYRKAINAMTSAILESIQKSLSKAEYDRTFTATVCQKTSDSKGRIFYNGLTYPFTSTVAFAGGDTVRVCAPCNRWDDLFIVENKSANRKGDGA